ncbi:MAG: chemotaxis protein CheC [Bacillaceae bacterium]|nr:chemotaxis protein CheC [Bacillaceae bacterium]
MTTNPKEFDDFQFDVLKEVGNIGAGNAATALSQLINKEIDMKVPQVSVLPITEIAGEVGGADALVVAVFLRILGDVPGYMFFVLNEQSARNLVKQMTGVQSEPDDVFSDMEISALNEVGNILSGSYLSSMADLTGLNMQPSVPAIAIDMAGAILSYGLVEISQSGDYALMIDTSFFGLEEEVTGHFFLLPDPDSFEKLFSALGVQL